MRRDDWEKPAHWRTCYELLTLSDRMFEAMLAAGLITYHTTRRQIHDFVRLQRRRVVEPIRSPSPPNQRIEHDLLNKVTCGDCLDLIRALPDASIGAVITSPPYADQRQEHYDGVSEEKYPQWFTRVMTELRPKLVTNGSVLVVIRTHLREGRISNYVLRTRLAVQEAGWVECEELIWHKPDGPPLGSLRRPRRGWESILWYSKTAQPYVDLKACGKPSNRIGLESANPHGNIEGTNLCAEGMARITDVFSASAGNVDEKIGHPAVFPPWLVRQLILTFAPVGYPVLDPFVGSGTTALVAQSLDYDFVGFDVHQEYVGLANYRLKT